MTGSWYAPERDGEGINIEVLEGVVVAYFYRPDHSNQRWYNMLGDRPEGDNIWLDVYQSIGINDIHWVGDALISITGNDSIVFSYDFRYDLTLEGDGLPWCLGCRDTFSYVRITQPIPCD